MKQSEKSALTKKKIVQAAMSLYEEKGTDAVSVNEICQAAQVAVGTFYYYYSSKEDIFLQVNQDAAINLERRLKQFKDESDPEKYLQTFFAYYAEQNQAMGTDGVARLRNDRYVRSVSPQKGENKLFSLLETRLSAFQQAGLISQDYSAAHITNEMFICARGLIFEWCVENGGFDLVQGMRVHMAPYITYYTM